MKVYIGKRSKAGLCSVRYVLDGDTRMLPMRFDLANHSPTGFEWGYGGSGSAQLAIALIADAAAAIPGMSRSRILRLHQRFKWRVVCKLPLEGWKLTQLAVLTEVNRILVTSDDTMA